ncbi:type VI secretion system membrane subunit TssM [Rhizobium straminoryzae]|uniref:Type VI secretion system membrane subunit TssM n=1 Tax=Rhizobium straminoryzae TaxID=1387186 RepID=A0A549TFL7_9HYPH|nr:type VI secretion system membrane subunit TssM [Rhizobium straminoryzae]TRL41318.1 type VI secretion system membrane subunit TssM [Rhizobium straminoryzae]
MNPLSIFYTIRSYVDSYAGLIGRRFISVIWLVALCVIIWFYGSLLAFGQWKPLVSINARLVVIATLVLAWVVYIAVTIIRSRRRDAALVDGIEQSAAAEAEASQRAEVGEIHQRLKEALTLLRRVTRKRFGYIYELPWYVIFGAPGSGKTTALTQSGLNFPLGDALGSNSVQGIGGTRNCNWWFTDEAILIDTAGRYTTQDDLNGTAKAGWEGFLGLLRRYRRSQPINGALVTLSVGDLLERDPQAQKEEIRIIRQRLAELDEQLQVRVPVYIVLTKADLLTGFVEFFDGFGKSDREQVWGMTFALDTSDKASELAKAFGAEFALLQERVSALLLERLQQEPNAEIRGRIFRFPAQLALLRERLDDVMTELAATSKLMEPPLIRGIYLASGTQNSPESVDLAPVRPRRSYFLKRLFHDVIFEEAALVARDRRLSRRQLIIRRSIYAMATAFVLVVLASWIATYWQNSVALADADRHLDTYEQLAKGIPVENVKDTDFLRILPPLDSLAAIPDSFEQSRTWPMSFGLDQQEKVEKRHRDAYQRALNALLLPRLMVQLQRDMLNEKDPQKVFNALKLYGMLGGVGTMDGDFATLQMQDMFRALLPGDARAAARAALSRHSHALVQGVIPLIELDNRLIAEARGKIRDISIASRAYEILRNVEDARRLPAWTPAAALGPLGEQAFERGSGASLRQGLPGLLTARGFQSVVGPRLDEAARDAIGEEWVRGSSNPPDTSVDQIAQAVFQLYVSDFELQWRTLLGDLRVKTPQTLADAAEVTRLLSSEPSPIEALVRSIAAATDLRSPDALVTGSIGESDPGNGANVVAISSLPDPYAGLRDLLGAPDTNKATGEATGLSDQKQLPPLRQLVSTIQKLREQLSRASTSTETLAKVFDVDGQLTAANQDLLQQARQMPAPLDAWMAGMAADIGSLAVRSARARIADMWASEAANYCSSAIANRYPFDRNAVSDVAMSDFIRLFAPDGLLKTFFKQNLEPFVDTSASPWGWKGTFGSASIPSEAIAAFDKADQITRAFFPNGSKQPSITINVTPVSLSDAANAVMLDVAGEKVVYFHGPILSKSITWPGGQAANSSRLAFQPGGWQEALTVTGDWSAFRLFDRAKLSQGSQPNLFRAVFQKGEQTAQFDVQFGSVLNPFRLPALDTFSCPGRF